MKRQRPIFALFVTLLLASASALRAEDALHWKADRTVDASISNLPFQEVLGRIAASSGWKVYTEPGLDAPVSVTFKNRSQGEALKLLLSGFNYALVPEVKGAPRLFVYKSSLSGATELVRASKPSNWLANELIVTLSPGSNKEIERLAKELGATITGRSEELNSYRLKFDTAEDADKAREELASREGVQTSDNYAYTRPASAQSGSVNPAGMFPIDPTPVTAGEQITVALVDTPIQQLNGKMKDFVLPSISVKGETATPATDSPTHATSMAETLLSSMALANKGQDAGKVRVLPVDIYGNSETTSTFEVSQGLYKAIQANPRVINLSLGGTGSNPMVEYLLESARQKDILVFASAGNTPTTQATYPAASPNVIAVTAADWNGNLASYANRGDFVDAKAPGSSYVHFNGQRYISTGTSTATAFVSGQAAALTAQGYTPSQAASMILQRFDVNAPARAPGQR